MSETGLIFFTHEIGSEVHGGWYRVLSTHDVEVIGVGLMETVVYAGFDAESVARSVLENFVRSHAAEGNPVPALDKPRIADINRRL